MKFNYKFSIIFVLQFLMIALLFFSTAFFIPVIQESADIIAGMVETTDESLEGIAQIDTLAVDLSHSRMMSSLITFIGGFIALWLVFNGLSWAINHNINSKTSILKTWGKFVLASIPYSILLLLLGRYSFYAEEIQANMLSTITIIIILLLYTTYMNLSKKNFFNIIPLLKQGKTYFLLIILLLANAFLGWQFFYFMNIPSLLAILVGQLVLRNFLIKQCS